MTTRKDVIVLLMQLTGGRWSDAASVSFLGLRALLEPDNVMVQMAAHHLRLELDVFLEEKRDAARISKAKEDEEGLRAQLPGNAHHRAERLASLLTREASHGLTVEEAIRWIDSGRSPDRYDPTQEEPE